MALLKGVGNTLTCPIDDEHYMIEPSHRVLFAGIGVAMSSLVIVVSGSIMVHELENTQKAPTVELISSANKINLGNAQLRDASIKVMEKYAKENHVKVAYSPNKEMVNLSVVENKKECTFGIDYLQSIGVQYYSLNGAEFKTDQKIDKSVANELCKPEGNVLQLHMKLK